MTRSIKEVYREGLMSARRLPDKGISGIITGSYEETIGKIEEERRLKTIIEVDDGEYRIALNATQAKSLAKAYGDDPDEWVGKKVKVTKGRTHFGKDTVDCLIVMPAK